MTDSAAWSFTIEDEIHAAGHGTYSTLDSALGEMNRLVRIPWDEPPNRAPCASWATCGRDWELIEWDASETPPRIRRKTVGLYITASGHRWYPGPEMIPIEDLEERHPMTRSAGLHRHKPLDPGE